MALLLRKSLRSLWTTWGKLTPCGNKSSELERNNILSILLTKFVRRIDTPKEQFDALFKNLDINDDGKLGFEEFLMGMRWLQKVHIHYLLFNKVPKNWLRIQGMRITNASEVQMKPTPTQQSKPKSSSKSSSAKDKETIAALTEKNKILVNVSQVFLHAKRPD